MQALPVILALAFAALSVIEVVEVSARGGGMVGAFLAGAAAVGAAATAVTVGAARRQQRAALLRGLEALRFFDAAAILLADAGGRIRYVNDAAATMYGRSRDALIAMRLRDLRHPSAPTCPRGEAGVDKEREAYASLHERADGTSFPVEVVSVTLVLDGEEHALAVVRDVTEERLAEAAMTESAAQCRTVFQSVPMIQFSLDADGRFTLLEGRGLELLRLQPGALVGRTLFETARRVPELIKGFLRAVSGTIFSGTYRVGRHHFEIHWAPLLRDDGTVRGVSAVALDVSRRVAAERARKESEARLVAAERLASMGRLAAGVAHEINNPLSWVMSNLELAIDRAGRFGASGELVELVSEAREGAARVRDIVRDLRVFARAEREEGGGCYAESVVRATLAMARNEIRHRARVEAHFEPTPPVAIPERQLGQVLVNLLVNAAQAIGEGAAAENLIRVDVHPDGEGVAIEVKDSGCGMPEEVRERIFEPFFSTKRGEGMGLGLALCQTMVQEAGGRIEVESAPAAGSTFRVRLPALARPGPGAEERSSRPASAGGAAAASARRARLLVVDDEPLVGKAVARTLAEHEVEYVQDAREALDRIHAGSRYDAVICDLMMPEMTGMELAQRLTDEHNELSRHMVFLTGGAFTDGARTFVALTSAPVVEKPFEHVRLRESVDAAIRG